MNAHENYNCFEKAILTTGTVQTEMPVWDNYLTVIEASRCLKVHPETVKRLCRQGDLPATKFHNTWLINRDILDNFAGTYNRRVGARKMLMK
jgi:excisionase family DNA binding protein